LPAKIVVNSVKGGSRISLLGSSGKELLGSVVFKEPRAKGATLRALKGLLGETQVEDHTLRAPQRAGSPAPAATAAAEPAATPTAPARKSRTAKVTKASTGSRRRTATSKTTAAPETAVAPKVAAARKTTKAATARP
jgi:hypothetical protein